MTEKNFYVHVNRFKDDPPTNSPTTGRDLVAGAVRPAPVTAPVNRQNAAQPLPQGEVGPTAAFVHNAQSSLDEQW